MKDGCNKDGAVRNNTFFFPKHLFSLLCNDLKETDLKEKPNITRFNKTIIKTNTFLLFMILLYPSTQYFSRKSVQIYNYI